MTLKQLQAALDKYVVSALSTSSRRRFPRKIDDTTFKVQALSPAQADAVRADFLVYNQRVKDAKPLLERVLRDDPNNTSAHETMGYIEFRQGNLAEAQKWYEQAVKLNSQSFLAYYYFAATTMNGGQLDSEKKSQVENSLRTAIKLNPSFAPAYDELAVFYGMRRENLDEAHMLVLDAVELDPGNLHYRLTTANILLQMQRPTDAITVLQNASELGQDARRGWLGSESAGGSPAIPGGTQTSRAIPRGCAGSSILCSPRATFSAGDAGCCQTTCVRRAARSAPRGEGYD